jgi:carbamoylphosphate synthase small subunit
VIITDGSYAGQVVIIADVSYANGSSPPDRITTGFELAVKDLVITFQFHKG